MSETFVGLPSGIEPSEVGKRVAALLDAWRGLHHFEERVLRKVDWANPLYIDMALDHRMSTGQLSTYDFSGLTELVFLAHDHAIRVDIRPCNGSHLKLTFHPRGREGGMSQRHPTLDAAFLQWRQQTVSQR